MAEARHSTRPTVYANSDDFRQIFEEDMTRLYRLALLLTADRGKAEQCFVSGLEDAVEGNPVFMEWARSWARRAIIQNAVRLIHPRPVEGNGHSSSALLDGKSKTLADELPEEIAAVLELQAFERFVYVMTVLERYSDHECSLLLGCGRRDVLAARTRTLQGLGIALEVHFQHREDAGIWSAAHVSV